MNTCQNLLLVVIIFPKKLEEFTLGKIQEFTLARIYICPKLYISAYFPKKLFSKTYACQNLYLVKNAFPLYFPEFMHI